jgi:hypothetical protein
MSADPRYIDHLAKYAYHLGTSPMEWAEKHITMLVDIHQLVGATRADEPDTFPGYCIELTTDALARRILGELLDAGWTCPDAAEVLQGYKPPQLSAEVKTAIAFLNSLPDYGGAAQEQAVAELGQTAPITDLMLRAAEIARGGQS